MNFAEVIETVKDRRKRKPYIAALILVILYLMDIFWISGILGRKFGILGTVLHEMLLAAMGILVFVCMRGRLKVIFPFRKPSLSRTAGTIVLWMGVYALTLFVTMAVTFFFPEEVMGASRGVNMLVAGMPLWMSVLVIALTPAICEEIAFRGALLSCFRRQKNRWIGIILVSLFFGFCHGSIWRMIPTAMLGAAMGYLLFETENMFYNMLFHFVNNLLPALLVGIANLFSNRIELAAETVQTVEIPLGIVGFYLMCAGGAPILMYLGNYLLHRGLPGYDRGAFPKEKKKVFMIMVGTGVACILLGMFLIGMSAFLQMVKSTHGLY